MERIVLLYKAGEDCKVKEETDIWISVSAKVGLEERRARMLGRVYGYVRCAVKLLKQ